MLFMDVQGRCSHMFLPLECLTLSCITSYTDFVIHRGFCPKVVSLAA